MVDDFSESDGSEYKQSKYNSAISQLYRLDNLWKDCHNHMRKGMFPEWNWDLDAVWTELAGDIKEDSNDNKKYIEINKEIAKLYNDLEKRKLKVVEFRTKIYQIQLEKEIFLRRVLNKQGKGTSYYDELEDDFE